MTNRFFLFQRKERLRRRKHLSLASLVFLSVWYLIETQVYRYVELIKLTLVSNRISLAMNEGQGNQVREPLLRPSQVIVSPQ